MYTKPKGSSSVPSQTTVPAAMRYPAEGKGYDYTNARPLSFERGEDFCIPKPGRPWTEECSATMMYGSTTGGRDREQEQNKRDHEKAAEKYDNDTLRRGV